MASTFALSRPSEKFGTHSTRVDITRKNIRQVGRRQLNACHRLDTGAPCRRPLPHAFHWVTGNAFQELLMPKFVIERELPGAGRMTSDQLAAVSQTSCGVLRKLGPEIQWIQSYVTD